MLAQNFKTAEDLGIQDEELAALITVLGMLERGELKHVPDDSSRGAFPVYPQHAKVGMFNMNWWSNAVDCGTVCCIGGTVEAIMKKYLSDGSSRNPHLRKLFYPGNAIRDRDGYSGITPDQAAAAVRSYLTTGNANWRSAIGK